MRVIVSKTPDRCVDCRYSYVTIEDDLVHCKLLDLAPEYVHSGTHTKNPHCPMEVWEHSSTPCPFCGGPSIRISERTYAQCVCEECGAEGPIIRRLGRFNGIHCEIAAEEAWQFRPAELAMDKRIRDLENQIYWLKRKPELEEHKPFPWGEKWDKEKFDRWAMDSGLVDDE